MKPKENMQNVYLFVWYIITRSKNDHFGTGGMLVIAHQNVAHGDQ